MSRERALLLATFLCALAGLQSLDANAQVGITIAAGSTPSSLVAPSAQLAVPIVVDMSRATGLDLATLATIVTWGSSALTLDSVRAGTFGALTTNTAPGTASLSLSNATGTTTTVTIATLFFTAGAALGGTQVALAPGAAATQSGISLANVLHPRALDVCVAATGKWGDATGDGVVNIIDAQQIARYSVGLGVANAWAVQGRGDVNADGAVNVIDAQQVARVSVNLPVTSRVNTTLLLAPAVSSVAIGSAPDSLQAGQRVQLSSTSLDQNNAPLGGCGPVAWASSDTTVASISAGGQLVGRSTGPVTITASSGGRTANATLPIKALFQDKFLVPGNHLDLAAWTTEFGNASYIPWTQLADWVTPGGVGTFVVGANGAELALNTFNPSDPGHASLFGTHGKTLQSFQPSASTSIYFTAQLQLTSVQPGIVYGVYLYQCAPGCANHDEIDIELLTNELQPGAQKRVSLNHFAAEPLGVGHPSLVDLPTNFDPLAPHEWTIRWSLTQVDYLVDGILLSTATTNVPQGAMMATAIAWGPYTQWPLAYSASLQPAGTAQQNSRFVAYLRSVVVSAF